MATIQADSCLIRVLSWIFLIRQTIQIRTVRKIQFTIMNTKAFDVLRIRKFEVFDASMSQ